MLPYLLPFVRKYITGRWLCSELKQEMDAHTHDAIIKTAELLSGRIGFIQGNNQRVIDLPRFAGQKSLDDITWHPNLLHLENF